MTRLALDFMVNQKSTSSAVSYVDFLLYNLNKPFTNVLKAYLKEEDNNAKNFTTFFNYIRNVTIEVGEILLSFDVTSLYRSIHTTDGFH